MLNEQTFEKLYTMKLNGMADAFKEQMMQPDMNELSFEERFAFLVDQHCVNGRLKLSHFRS